MYVLENLAQRYKGLSRKLVEARKREEIDPDCIVDLSTRKSGSFLVTSLRPKQKETQNEDKHEKIYALSLAKECYSMKQELLTNATVVDEAIRFIAEKSKDKNKDKDEECKLRPSSSAGNSSNEDDNNDDNDDKDESSLITMMMTMKKMKTMIS